MQKELLIRDERRTTFFSFFFCSSDKIVIYNYSAKEANRVDASAYPKAQHRYTERENKKSTNERNITLK